MPDAEVTGQRALALFLLGVLLFNPPLLSLFNDERLIFGVPLLYFYLFAAWGLVILLLGLISRHARVAKAPPADATDTEAREAG